MALGADLINLSIDNIDKIHECIETIAKTIGHYETKDLTRLRSMRRKRMAPLGIIGSLSSSLFGLVTEDEIHTVNKNLDKLFADQKQMTKLGNEKAHLISANLEELFNISKAHETRVNELEKVMVTNLNLVRKDEEEIRYMVELSVYLKQIEAQLRHMEKGSEELLEILLQLQAGKIHSTLLKSEAVKQIVKDINEIDLDLDFPLSTKHLNPDAIQRISKVDGIYTGNRVIIVLHLPLVDRSSYHLYKIHSLAVHQVHDNQTIGVAYIQPSHKYLALRSDQNQFVKFNEDYLNDCLDTPNGYICKSNLPFMTTARTPDCEINMLLSPNANNLRTCNIIYHRDTTTQWKFLSSDGTWLFANVVPETLRVSCAGKTEESLLIRGSGIFRMADSCVARTPNALLVNEKTK